VPARAGTCQTTAARTLDRGFLMPDSTALPAL